MQGWSCCNKKSTDFTLFLNMPVSTIIISDYHNNNNNNNIDDDDDNYAFFCIKL